jgi:hypothetical protein
MGLKGENNCQNSNNKESRCTQMSNAGTCGVSACDEGKLLVDNAVVDVGPGVKCPAAIQALDKIKLVVWEGRAWPGYCCGWTSKPDWGRNLTVLCLYAQSRGRSLAAFSTDD